MSNKPKYHYAVCVIENYYNDAIPSSSKWLDIFFTEAEGLENFKSNNKLLDEKIHQLGNGSYKRSALLAYEV